MQKLVCVMLIMVGCHKPTNATIAVDATPSSSASPVASTSGSASEDDESNAEPTGPCPSTLSPGYCLRCRTFDDRMRTHHAKRIKDPSRVGYGTCGADRVFAEDDRARDAGIVEYFNDAGLLVAARDARNDRCKDFGAIPACTPDITWSTESDGGVDHWPTVRIRDITTKSLPPEVIQRIVRRWHGALLGCYFTGLRANPSLAGKISLSFTIDAAGNARDVKQTSTLPDASVTACVASFFDGMGFPAPEKAPDALKLTIDLERGRLENPLLF